VLVQGVSLTLGMEKYGRWNGRFQSWNVIVWKILPAMEYGRLTFHSIVCPDPRDLLPTHGLLYFSTVVSHFTTS